MKQEESIDFPTNELKMKIRRGQGIELMCFPCPVIVGN